MTFTGCSLCETVSVGVYVPSLVEVSVPFWVQSYGQWGAVWRLGLPLASLSPLTLWYTPLATTQGAQQTLAGQ